MDKVSISDEDRRLLGAWAADCAERVLPLFEAKAPTDTRPREAVEGIRVFTRDGKRTARLRSVAVAALAAARDVDDPVAAAAARAAGYAAASPYIHPIATPHQAKHALGPAMYVAHARELAADGDAGAGAGAGDEEIRWAIEHAPPAVGGILRQMPLFVPGRSRLDAYRHRLETALRG
ncbi:putative immunity protein [Kitasatospora sp. NPDC003701]